MRRDFQEFFKEAKTWRGKAVVFALGKVRITGTVEEVWHGTEISDGQGRNREARLAQLNVRTAGEPSKGWEVDRNLYKIQFNFEHPAVSMEKTPEGNIFFRNQSTEGMIILTEAPKVTTSDPLEPDHREPGTQHL